MLIRTLQTEMPPARNRRNRRRRVAQSLPAARVKQAVASAADWLSLYPCTRMHGALFESEFYSAEAASV